MLSPSSGDALAFDPTRAYRLAPNVAVRAEPAGGLVYHHGSRRLAFLRSPLLVELLRELERHDSVEAALALSSIPSRRRPAFRRALAALAASEIICAR